ncbi:MAG TPA: hypothetical protein VF587_17100 [Solirubrobacteraceae bacterium]
MAALTGCGEDEPTRTAPPPAKEPGAIAIAEPADDAKVKAREEGTELRARPAVEGTADAGAEVIVNGGCDVEGCLVHTTAGDDGRWEAEVRLVAPADAPKVRIVAYYRGSVVGPEDRVELRLAGPEAEPARRGRPGARRGGGGRRGDGGARTPVSPQDVGGPQPIPPPTNTGSGTMVLVGDSLAVGMEEPLRQMLSGWQITADALTSRPLDVGMGILARTRVPDGAVVAISLFTNDDPTRTDALAQAVRTSVKRAGPRGCAVWATIARPPFNGRSYAAANAVLHRLDAEIGRRLVVVPWAEQAARNGWLGPDRVHGTPEGYRQRAAMYAQAARSC